MRIIKNLLIWIVFLSFATNLLGQVDGECGTTLTPKDIAIINKRLEENSFSNGRVAMNDQAEDIFIGITAHIVRRSDATGGLSETQLTSAIAYLNETYAPMNMNFFLVGDINYIDSDSYFDFDSSKEFEITGVHNVDNTINIYFYNSLSSGSSALCGYAYFPSTGRDHVMMANGCTVNQGSTLPHEIGHYFNLYHTHGKTNTGTTDELVDGSNCSTAGDNVCDTSADPNLSGKVDGSCAYTGTNRDANGQLFSPDPRNFMSYAPGQCRELFSSGQSARIVTAYQTFKTYLLDKYYAANFSAKSRRVCEGGSIQFTDESIAASTFSWEFPGGNPSTSSDPFPMVTYPTAGNYDVSLTVTTESGDMETKILEDYVVVLDQTDGIASTSGSFEDISLTEELINEDLGITFEVSDVASTDGSQSAKMDFANYSQIGAEDFLVMEKLLTSVNKQFEVSFDYAYARYDDEYFDGLAIVIKDQCGEWFDIWKRTGLELATAADHDSPFVPTAEEWKTVSFIVQIPDEYDNTEIAFKAINGFGNNLYIDNYAVSPAAPSFSIESVATTDASCSYESDGQIELSVTGAGTFSYSIENDVFQSSNTFSGLAPGVYNIVVKDQSETLISTYASIGPNPIEYNLNITNPACKVDKGMVSFEVSGGTGGLEINFNNLGFTTDLEFTELPIGNYPFVVRDANGCTSEGSLNISAINRSPSKPSIRLFSNILSIQVDANVTGIQWYLDGEILDGFTKATLANPTAGSYTVEVYNASCSAISDAFIVLTADEIKANLVIAPNPVKDILTIELPVDLRNEVTAIKIMDLSGRIIKRVNFEEKIDVADLRPGIYVVSLLSNDGTVTKRFIKN